MGSKVRMITVLLCGFLLFAPHHSVFAAIGPEYYAYITLEESIGCGPGIIVLPPRDAGNETIIDIAVNNPAKRSALATIIRDTMFADHVKIHVINRNGDVEPPQEISGPINDQIQEILDLLETGLGDNPYVESLSARFIPFPAVFVVVGPYMAQILTHDMSEVNGLNTYTIEKLFEDCLQAQIGDVFLHVSTVSIP